MGDEPARHVDCCTTYSMDVLQAIGSRRSVRTYSSDPVDEATLHELLAAAVQAPSALNHQPWGFAIVQDIGQLKRYSDRIKAMNRASTDPKAIKYGELMSSSAFDVFYDAGTLVVIGVEERTPYSEADVWLAAENFMLAACAAKLGTCCVGFAAELLKAPEVKAELGFAEAGAAIAAIVVGYPSLSTPGVLRRAPKIVSWSR